MMKTFQTAFALRTWVRSQYSPAHTRKDLARQYRMREAVFLEFLRTHVYGFPASPYLALLRHADCQFEDLRRLVQVEGLESALEKIAAEGVYVTHDEMKGREPAVRGSAVFQFQDRDFDNPAGGAGFCQKTSGSTGTSTRVHVGIDHFREQIPHTDFSATIHGVNNGACALWVPPSEWGVSRLLRLGRIGIAPERWFSQVPLGPGSTLATTGARATGLVLLLRLFGMKAPFLTSVPVDEAITVLGWMKEALKQHSPLMLVSYPSTAARLCALARQDGVSLEGSLLLVGGESVTASKRSIIEATGAACLPLFGSTETGESAEGCLRPSAADDMHLYANKFVLVTRKRKLNEASEVDALLFTSLGSATPKVFLNGETGDAGIVEDRDCGCPWSEIGFRRHVRDIWSFSKINAEGMTLPGSLVLRVIEEVLPQKLGGKPGDCQLIAETGKHGLIQYRLSVNPALGVMDEKKVRSVFLSELIAAGASSTLEADLLNRAGQLRIVRQEPLADASGKSLPVLVKRIPE